MKKIKLKNLMLDLFLHKSRAYAIGFLDEYDPNSEKERRSWHAEVIHVADNAIAVVACHGVGDSFAYDITYDRSAENLYTKLMAHSFSHALPEEVWIDEESVVSISFTKSKESPAALAVENNKMSELLLFISDEFDRGHCNHTEIEERLDAFFR